MAFTIAICPDDYTNNTALDKVDAASPRWEELICKEGHEVKWIDVKRADSLSQISGCDGFMWRWAHFQGMARIAKRLLPAIENGLGIPVYPNQQTCWHYDDKIAQSYLFDVHKIPRPKTWVWFDKAKAIAWAKTAEYPIVLKLAAGAGSSNVKLITCVEQALSWIDRLFNYRLISLDEEQFHPYRLNERLSKASKVIICGEKDLMNDNGYDEQTGYALFQEFLPENDFDTRVTVIGNRAFAFRRFCRPGDFRASGSGIIDHTPHSIDPEFIKLAFGVAKKLNMQSCAIDGMYRDGKPVIGEVSYTYASWAVHECSGHWDSKMNWQAGEMWPEEAQVKDFLGLIARHL